MLLAGIGPITVITWYASVDDGNRPRNMLAVDKAVDRIKDLRETIN
jgi:hypothetical protein